MHDLKKKEEKKDVHLSRWGFHPCDHQTFLKLKELKKLFWLATYQYGAWRRWERKLPKNRFYWNNPNGSKEGASKQRSDRPIPEPLVCPLWQPKCKWGSNSVLDDNGLLEAFEAARMPHKNATDVKPLKLTAVEIDHLLAEAREWWAENDEARKAA